MSRRFRSGTGGTYSGSTWEDWDGISPNGRQYRNAITQETRNLSGAEYWAARKSDYPSQYPETWKDGKANIEAFKEEPVKKGGQRKEEPLEYKLFPQQKAVDKIEAMIEDVEKKYMSLELSDEQYREAMGVLDARMAKAWLSLCKAKGWTEELEEEEIKKDIGRLGVMIEKQKEKNAREALKMQARGGRVQHRRPQTKAQGTGAVWFIVCLLVFILFF